MAIRRVFLIRHGETDWNREGRFQGHIDVPLNDLGRSQIRDLTPHLESASLEAVLTSDLSRAYESGKILADLLKLPIHTTEKLREAFLGQAQGLTHAEMIAQFGDHTVDRWRSYEITDAEVRFPGGESGSEIMDRVFGSLEAFLDQNPAKSIAVATHGGVIRRIFQKIAPPGTPPVPIPNGVLYEIHFHGETRAWMPSPETLHRIKPADSP